LSETGNRTVEGFFAGRPEAFRLFEALRKEIEALGQVKMEVMKTQVSFGAKRKFAWVWLPQMWVRKRPETSITLTFCLDREVRHPRIAEAVEPSPGKWTHHVLIDRIEDIDDEVREWLKEAYDFGNR
jgi:predicted transport protein